MQRPRRIRLQLRTRGALVCDAAFVAVVLGIAGIDAGWLAATALGALAVTALGAAALAARALEPSLQSPLRTTAGRTRWTPVALRSNRCRSAFWRVRLAAPGRLGLAPWSAVPRGATEVAAALIVARRGAVRALAAEIEGVDPLGLCAVRRTVHVPAEGWVLPRPAPRGAWLRAALQALAAGTGEAALHAARAGEVAGLEAWRPGAPLRRLHAAASLRAGQPLQLAFAGGSRAPVHVVLRAAEKGSGAAFEAAVSVAATLVTSLAAEGRHVALSVPATAAGARSARGADAALGALARAVRGAASGAEPELPGQRIEVAPEGELAGPKAPICLECAADGAVYVVRSHATRRAGRGGRALAPVQAAPRSRRWVQSVRTLLGIALVGLGVAAVALAIERTRGPLGLGIAAGALLGGALLAARATAREFGDRPAFAARRGAGVALAALALTLALLGLGGAARKLSARSDSAPDRGQEGAQDVADQGSAEPRPGGGERSGDGPSDAVREVLDFSAPSPSSLVSDAEVLRVEAVEPPASEPALYLKHLTLGRLERAGLTSVDTRPPRARRDRDDGVVDGWVTLATPSADAPARRMSLTVRPLTLGTRAWTLLPVPTPAYAVSVEPVRYAEDGPSVLDRAERGRVLRYDVLAGARQLTRRDLAARRAIGAEEDLALPPDSPALRTLRARARRLTRGAESDLDKVLAVVQHLQGFEYGLETSGFLGVEALAAFLERGRGHCTECAATAMVLLRQSGVPARVAVGFLARADESDTGTFTARERDAHAWLEVPFEGVGWLTFDPTPSVGRHGGLESGWSPLADEPPAARQGQDWLGAAFVDAFDAWRVGDVGVAELAAAALARLWPLLILAAALALWSTRSGQRRDPRRTARERTRPVSRPADLHQALSVRLAALGAPRPAERPLAEHAAGLATQGRAPEVLPNLVQAAYAERFGRGPQSPQAPALWEVATNLELAQPGGHSTVADPRSE